MGIQYSTIDNSGSNELEYILKGYKLKVSITLKARFKIFLNRSPSKCIKCIWKPWDWISFCYFSISSSLALKPRLYALSWLWSFGWQTYICFKKSLYVSKVKMDNTNKVLGVPLSQNMKSLWYYLPSNAQTDSPDFFWVSAKTRVGIITSEKLKAMEKLCGSSISGVAIGYFGQFRSILAIFCFFGIF